MSTGRQIMGLNPKFVSSDVSVFLLPYMDERENKKSEGLLSQVFIQFVN